MSEQQGLVVVTGAGGFIGSHLVEELLRSGRTVRALVHYNALASTGHLAEVQAGLGDDAKARLQIVSGDIGDARCVRELVAGAEIVYHLAALIGIPYSYQAPQSYVTVNVVGTLNVLEACRDATIARLVHTSTSEVYGTALTTPMDEAHPLQAQSPYSATKIAADKLVESYLRSFGVKAVTVRPFNTYGPRQSLRAVIPTVIAQALSPECKSISLGSLDPVRDFTYVVDTVRAFRMVGDAPEEKVLGATFNLGVGRGISIDNVARLILDTLKVDKPIEEQDERRRPGPSEVQTLISNNTHVRQHVGWIPEIGLAEGITQTAEWIRPRLGTINPEVYRR